MRRPIVTRNSFLLLAACLVTVGAISVINELDEHVKTTTTTSSTTTTDSSDDVKPKKEELFCPATIKRGVIWENTKAGTISSAACPIGSDGRQIWECSPEGRWVTENPNTAGCDSNWIVDWLKELKCAFVKGGEMKWKPQYPLVEGDWDFLLPTLNSLRKLREENPATTNQKLCDFMVIEISKQIVRESQIWENLDHVKRKKITIRLFAAMETALASQSRRDKSETEANLEGMTFFGIFFGILCLTIVIIRFDYFLAKIEVIHSRSLEIIKQFCNLFQSCFECAHKKLSQMVWFSQLITRDKKTDTSSMICSKCEQLIGDNDQNSLSSRSVEIDSCGQKEDPEDAEWDTCEVPLLDMCSRIAELEKELVVMRNQQKTDSIVTKAVSRRFSEEHLLKMFNDFLDKYHEEFEK